MRLAEEARAFGCISRREWRTGALFDRQIYYFSPSETMSVAGMMVILHSQYL
jgi:hypothetical protein